MAQKRRNELDCVTPTPIECESEADLLDFAFCLILHGA
jgi:hypothetical protein